MHVHAHHQHIFFLCLVCDQRLQGGSTDGKTSCTQRPLDTECRKARGQNMRGKSGVVGGGGDGDEEGQGKREK